MRAWFSGAFEHCLALCEAARARDAESRVHFALLKSRALLRLDRPDEAFRVLRDAAAIPCGADESATLRMLTGAALVRRGEFDRGLEMLLALQHDVRDVHRTIRSEIALNVALAHWSRRDLDAAEAALHVVDSAADIVYARALEYRGWIAYARTDVARATAMFADALETLDRCRHYDRFLEANCIRALAHLAVERLDRRTWAIVEDRRSRFDWTASGLAQPQFWITYCASAYALDAQGNTIKAAREARHAEQIAPSTAYRVQARCKRASVARCAGEVTSQRDHAESAEELFLQSKPAQLAGDEAIVPLILAEELAHVPSTDEARSILDTYLKTSRTSAVLAMTHAPTTYAHQRLVEGTVSESAGDRRTAIRRYREAFNLYARIGYKRRAVIAALSLVRLTGDQDARSYAESETRQLPMQSWMRQELEKTKARAVKLTAVQREVLVLICHGKSNPEIGRLRKRSLHTIRNLVSRLFEIFEVSSREELAVECVRRGLYTPN
jgi:DNA-binding CsgD family transcriptional regulator